MLVLDHSRAMGYAGVVENILQGIHSCAGHVLPLQARDQGIASNLGGDRLESGEHRAIVRKMFGQRLEARIGEQGFEPKRGTDTPKLAMGIRCRDRGL